MVMVVSVMCNSDGNSKSNHYSYIHHICSSGSSDCSSNGSVTLMVMVVLSNTNSDSDGNSKSNHYSYIHYYYIYCLLELNTLCLNVTTIIAYILFVGLNSICIHDEQRRVAIRRGE